QSQKFPRHLIYRGPGGATESQMILIDSINVTAGRFAYVDSGQFNRTPLRDDQEYCYRVMTKGTYGNKRIKEPLLNFSQINCGQPNDKEPPCKPELAIVAKKCDEAILTEPCTLNVFTNILTWKRSPDLACRLDTRSYNIYIASQVGADFSLYKTNVRDTFFVDSNDQLPSFARCYKISALDRAGNESALSEQFCFDNCPNYELPNVFTPNGDDCNERFSAFSDRQIIGENGQGPCGSIDPVEQKRRCARFVEQVTLTVHNRWGKEVYNYQSGGERSIYIDWDGRDNDGKELAAGVYYYNARVKFIVVDPAKQTRDIRGWVQIVR
ncbi:MAG: gliding motility-associated C-terminal domain-containing protein, partial [Cyclobacteriaceae bacterium]|nr:gliding motility-associated C-terminal domain-containing protein [Cyclobacteriaceae bacterium]